LDDIGSDITGSTTTRGTWRTSAGSLSAIGLTTTSARPTRSSSGYGWSASARRGAWASMRRAIRSGGRMGSATRRVSSPVSRRATGIRPSTSISTSPRSTRSTPGASWGPTRPRSPSAKRRW